jgi:phosphonate transport system permease protein
MAVADIGYHGAMARASAANLFRRKRLVAFGVPTIILAYLVYVFFAFDIPGLAERARMDNARILLADTYSHKVHVSLDNRSGETTVAIEGENKGQYAAEAWPAWVQRNGPSVVVELGEGEVVRFDPDAVHYAVPEYGLVSIRRTDGGIVLDTPSGEIPEWINASSTRVSITRAAGRVSVTRNRTEALRYFAGWELFFFTLDSPFAGKSWGELAALTVSGDQLKPGQANVAAMASDFWNNAMWRHRDVAWAIFETVLMAFLGTMGAMLVAFPLAFLAATNFSPGFLVRFGIRRLFDFLRGVDGLIWTIILSRAFGPGPLTGALAILTTDSGTFGKLFSEALENVDSKQIDGLRSTGANAVQRNRFGVIPQVAPVILSQVLYYLESNTRSATVIGAIVGGGIGLLLTQAIQTQKDWEEVSYYIILTLLMVSAMDILSGWLRQRLIGRSPSAAGL